MSRTNPRRILVIGSGGAGKTTLSAAISQATGLPIVHLDSLYWREGFLAQLPREEPKEQRRA